jgi:hypothetical protein
MLLVNPNVPERVECGPENARRVYLVRPPTVYERVKWRRAVAAAGGRYHGPLALLGALADGVRALMAGSPDELRDAVLSKIDAHRANMIAFGESARDADLADDEQRKEFTASGEAMAESGRALAVTESEVFSAYPVYAQMAADDQTYWEIAGIEAARLFLTGWEGFDAEFRRSSSSCASDDSLAAIPEGDFASIGLFIDRMTRITASQRKNLSLPASTPPAGATSTKSTRVPRGGSPKATHGTRRNLQ